ncbi:MAG TPA: DUF488 domain-containing protein [Thermoanaerobaculia bacterium]|nr:DUF488 domain-containing protein [Thermoanaerobaculia bacterium]
MLKRIYTIGHSTRTLAELVSLLREHHVRRLADVRRFPASQRHPHFSRESLQHSLPEHRIEYVHFEDLGGRRSPAKESRNTALESDAFRGYADHMGTPVFAAAIERLLDTELRTAIMCAEAKPSNCHRQLLSDDLVRRNVEVVHILGAGRWERHQLHTLARIEPDRVIYPAAQSHLFS